MTTVYEFRHKRVQTPLWAACWEFEFETYGSKNINNNNNNNNDNDNDNNNKNLMAEKRLLTTMLTIEILFTINSLEKKKNTIHSKHYLQFLSM